MSTFDQEVWADDRGQGPSDLRSAGRGRAPLLRLACLAAATSLAVLAEPAPARAIGGPSCLDQVTADFSTSPSTIVLGQSTTLTWDVRPPRNCTPLIALVNTIGQVPTFDSRVVTPTASTTYRLIVGHLGNTREWSATVRVTLPKENGRIKITIDRHSSADTFVDAVSSDESTGATVIIENDVALDLTPWPEIHIYPGVQILGGRGARHPGPLLYTTRSLSPTRLFVIGQYFDADNVRISGIRLAGPDPSVADNDAMESKGIWIDSSVNVEIDNNDIYGWRVAAISVRDSRGRIDRANGRGAVRIHDNDIHNNQRIGDGYGVVVGEGAYVLVEKNSFDNNRHAMAGDGSYGAGYFFYRNYVGTGGGHHGWWCTDWPFVWCTWSWQTHQVDMHGQQDCKGADGYCGVAGEYMDVRYNAILYDAGTALRVRGTPTVRMDVAHNYFRHETVWGNWQLWSGAMEQTDGTGAITEWGNTFMSVPDIVTPCDFDGDGRNDSFLATGSAWFVTRPPANTPRYLNTSSLRVDDLEFLDVNGDGRCDVRVRADGRISLGGRTPVATLARTDIVTRNTTSGQLRFSRLDGGGLTDHTFHSVPADRDVIGTGDFDGDGDSDVLLRMREPVPQSDGWFQQTEVLWLQDGAVVRRDNWGLSPLLAHVDGIADFDGDGASDVLWRDATGRFRLWYWGVGTQLTDIRWLNSGPEVSFDWEVEAVGDFTADGYSDIVWRHRDGWLSISTMVGNIHTQERWATPVHAVDPSWIVQGAGDFDADGRSDLLWRNSSDGSMRIWLSGLDRTAVGLTSPQRQVNPADQAWQISGISDFNHDGRADILWRRSDGRSSIWTMQGATQAAMHFAESPYFTVENSWLTQGLLPVTAGALSTVDDAAPWCPTPPPTPVECMRTMCMVNDPSWDYVPLPAGTSCRQAAGQCDGQGTCIVPPVPVSVPAGLYQGTIHADAGTSASISLDFSGAPESLSGRLDLGAGARFECHGLRDLPATKGIFLQGHRTGVNGDGSTNYWLTGQLALPEADIGILVSGARLSPDSTHFSGTARLLVTPAGPLDDCPRHWPFEATPRVEDRVVPSVIDMTREEAFATLQAEGLAARSSVAVDWSCNFIGVVMGQIPPEGTLVVPGSLVRIVIGTEPEVCR